MPPEFEKFLVEALLVISTSFLGLLVWLLQRIALSTSMLKQDVAILVERSTSQGREIKHLDGRVTRIEERKRTIQ